MPHFIIEQGNALLSEEDRRDAMAIVADAGANCDFIERINIKTRIADYSDFELQDQRTSFIHVTLRLLAGRTVEQKTLLSTAVRSGLVERFKEVQAISVEVCDMEPISYKKHLS